MTADAPLPHVPGYRVTGVLGRGGFGSVYAAVRQADGLEVALKLPHAGHPDALARLAREAELLRTLGPPFVPAFVAQGEEPVPFLAMERLAFPTLAALLQAAPGPMPLALFRERAAALLRAVAGVHAAGFVHRDLKPQNILLRDSPCEARLIDFGWEGLSAPLEAQREELLGGFGTPEYMSPEQCAGAAGDARSDLYSLGVILYEALTGARPFSGTAAELRQAHLGLRPADPSQRVPLPPELSRCILRCLEKEPGRRYEDAKGLSAPLDAACRESAPAQAPKPAPPRAGRASRKRPVGLVFIDAVDSHPLVQSTLAAFGGHLAHLEGARQVLAFTEERSDNPVRLAQRAAQRLVEQGACARARVHLASVVRSQRTPGGPFTFISPLFSKEGEYPARSDPPGVQLSPEAQAQEGTLEQGASSLNPPRLFGREALLSTLTASARAAVASGEGGMVTVLAAPGEGKSHLARELSRSLREQLPGAEVLALGMSEPVEGGGQALTRALTLLALGPSADGAHRGLEALARRLPDVGARTALAFTLGWLPPDAAEVRTLGAAPGALRWSAQRGLVALLRQRAPRGGLALVLDDAHLADDLGLDALEHVALASPPVPLWVCRLARPPFQRPATSRAATSPRHQALALGPLSAESGDLLCRALLAPVENVPARIVELLLERTGAVPGVLVELLRGLKGAGVIRRAARGSRWYVATDELDRYLELPGVEWVSERELAGLPEELRAHARLASLLGPAFTVEELAGVQRRLEAGGADAAFPLDAAVGVQRLLERELLTPQEGGRLRFRTELLRDAISRTTPQAQRQEIHQAAYEHHAEAVESDARLAQRAFHAERAGIKESAAAHQLQLAQLAQARHAYLDAEHCFTRALEQLAPDALKQRLSAHHGRGLMRYRVGRYEDALADLAQAQALAERLALPGLLAELLLEEATALDWMNEYHRSRHATERAEAIAPSELSARARAYLTLARGRVKFRLGASDAATALLQRAADEAEPLGDEGYDLLVVALLMLGPLLAQLGRLDDCEAAFRRAVELCRARGDTVHLGTVAQNRTLLHMARRSAEGALADGEWFREISLELGMLGSEYRAEYNLAELRYQLEDLDAAEAHALRAHALGERLLGAQLRPDALLLRARIAVVRGSLDTARALCSALRRDQAAAGASGREEALFLPPEQLLLAAVELATRGEHDAGAWTALLMRAPSQAVQSDRVELTELSARSAAFAGHLRAALEQVDEALALARDLPNLMEARLNRLRLALRARSEAEVG